MSTRDPTTLSNYESLCTRHITADFNIDFAKEQLTGNVTLTLEVLKKTDVIILDTSYLDVIAIKVDGSSTNWTLEARKEPYGSPLKIQPTRELTVGQQVNVLVCSLRWTEILLMITRLMSQQRKIAPHFNG